ncbi:hypothetical protein TNCV_2310121 [Trichonephila clavipes]|nr:hypothetical protein TNCV_2310121 [Trichonephila clavipes]
MLKALALNTLEKNAMSRNLFQKLKSCLYFEDNGTVSQSVQDRFFKVKPLFAILSNHFRIFGGDSGYTRDEPKWYVSPARTQLGKSWEGVYSHQLTMDSFSFLWPRYPSDYDHGFVARVSRVRVLLPLKIYSVKRLMHIKSIKAQSPFVGVVWNLGK